MKKSNIFIVVALLAVLLVGMSACSNSSEDAASINNDSGSDHISQSTDGSSESNDSSTDSTAKSDNSSNNHSDGTSIGKKVSIDTTNKIKENENIQEENTTNAETKIKGRRNVFLERLDNIQKELDALPEKKDSDKGVTNAMKNYYGISYEMYDNELNEIYALLKKELSPETMKDLKTEQIKWIEQKEKKANDERLKYNGGTFENVAMYISLYESTKERCYGLVNKYMTD
ncbi:lysozyme inhibitor LprI family protein [Neobacillus novalis]|uniref:lysozyme inhibitor LprI family protein n=1 Tax=Neobacillus novalis TaxID=220687 RepID=UPI0008247F79|nr:lysozyme inhibitor LprI family protein [Neobacillus novalis]